MAQNGAKQFYVFSRDVDASGQVSYGYTDDPGEIGTNNPQPSERLEIALGQMVPVKAWVAAIDPATNLLAPVRPKVEIVVYKAGGKTWLQTVSDGWRGNNLVELPTFASFKERWLAAMLERLAENVASIKFR